MGMGERARTPDFRSCDYRKHDDRETLESEGTMLEAALSGLQVPPGLERGNRIPNHLWKNLPDRWQEEVRAAGKRRRQLARRARNKDVAHPDLRWQSRQHGLCEQRSPQPWLHPQSGAFFDSMWMGFPHPHV